MIDYDPILDHFILVAREAVGSQLSEIIPSVPSVIRARQSGPPPDYPYIVLDIVNTTHTSGWKLASGLDDNDDPYVDTHYKMLLQYTVYGGNANEIAQNLESYFRRDRVLDDIETATTGQLEQTFAVISLPEVLSTEDLEVAGFNFTFNINDRDVDPQTGVFDRVILDGELARKEGDPDPLDMDVDVGPIL